MAFETNDGKVREYKKSIITHIDILGFSSFVRDEQTTCQHVDNLLSCLKIRLSHCDNNVFAVQLSDSIVRGRYFCPEKLVETAIAELQFLARAQYEITRGHRKLIRGGITKGDIWYEPGIVYGPGHITAYNLESNVAKVPRIVLDNDLICDLNTAIKNDSELEKLIARDENDEQYFVDYLSFIGEQEFADYINTIDRIRKDNSDPDPNVRGKMDWLAGYYHITARKRTSS